MVDSSITVLLNVFRRGHALEEQYAAISNQSVSVSQVMIWQNGDHVDIPAYISANSIIAKCNPNLGVWARFSFALLAETEFICVFDDDTIPGSYWLQNCLETMKLQEGLLGTRGLRFRSKKSYLGAEEVGWANPNEDIETVDIVGHSWFFRREWLRYFWSEPRITGLNLAGEDMHFSYALKKNLGLPTLVPPHPKSNLDLWGSLPATGLRLGTSPEGISVGLEAQQGFQSAYKFYFGSGMDLTSPGGLKDDIKAITLLGLSGSKMRRFMRRMPGFQRLRRFYLNRVTNEFNRNQG